MEAQLLSYQQRYPSPCSSSNSLPSLQQQLWSSAAGLEVALCRALQPQNALLGSGTLTKGWGEDADERPAGRQQWKAVSAASPAMTAPLWLLTRFVLGSGSGLCFFWRYGFLSAPLGLW